MLETLKMYPKPELKDQGRSPGKEISAFSLEKCIWCARQAAWGEGVHSTIGMASVSL